MVEEEKKEVSCKCGMPCCGCKAILLAVAVGLLVYLATRYGIL